MRLLKALLFSLLALNTVSCAPSPLPARPIPPATSIKSMSATLIGFPTGSQQLQEFSVPTEYFEKICSALSAAKPDPQPAKWEGIGYLHITTDSGDHLQISLFATTGIKTTADEQQAGLAYRIGPADYYRGGDATELAQLLRTAAESAISENGGQSGVED